MTTQNKGLEGKIQSSSEEETDRIVDRDIKKHVKNKDYEGIKRWAAAYSNLVLSQDRSPEEKIERINYILQELNKVNDLEKAGLKEIVEKYRLIRENLKEVKMYNPSNTSIIAYYTRIIGKLQESLNKFKTPLKPKYS